MAPEGSAQAACYSALSLPLQTGTSGLGLAVPHLGACPSPSQAGSTHLCPWWLVCAHLEVSLSIQRTISLASETEKQCKSLLNLWRSDKTPKSDDNHSSEDSLLDISIMAQLPQSRAPLSHTLKPRLQNSSAHFLLFPT